MSPAAAVNLQNDGYVGLPTVREVQVAQALSTDGGVVGDVAHDHVVIPG